MTTTQEQMEAEGRKALQDVLVAIEKLCPMAYGKNCRNMVEMANVLKFLMSEIDSKLGSRTHNDTDIRWDGNFQQTISLLGSIIFPIGVLNRGSAAEIVSTFRDLWRTEIDKMIAILQRTRTAVTGEPIEKLVEKDPIRDCWTCVSSSGHGHSCSQSSQCGPTHAGWTPRKVGGA